MAELKIDIVTNYQKGLQGLNKVVGGVDTLRKNLVLTKKGTSDYTKSSAIYVKAIQRELNQLAKHGESIASVGKQYELLSKQANYVVQAFGKSNNVYQLLSKSAAQYKTRLESLKKAERDRIAALEEQRKSQERIQIWMKAYEEENERAEKLRLKAIEDANKAAMESWERYTNFVQTQQQKISSLSANNIGLSQDKANASSAYATQARRDADLTFYKTIGDDVGYAREKLAQYEETLRKVLAAENVTPEVVDAATSAYKYQQKEVENLTTKHVSYGKKLLSITKNILMFQLIMSPIKNMMSGIGQAISESTRLAAEAEQVYSKLSTVFEGLEDSARKASNSIASSLGVANSTAASALSTVGDLLQAQGMGTGNSLAMASDWVKQFQDIIAFKDINMTLEEFAQNFMSGAAGNLRNFRTFGSIVKESSVNARLASKGLDQLTGSELELAKMTARAELALEQQANAIGATEREKETALAVNRRFTEANKGLKEVIGTSINESLIPFKEAWTEIADRIVKAKKAQEAVAAGAKNVKIYNPYQNESDKTSFIKEMNQAMKTSLGGQDLDPVSVSEKVLQILKFYDLTLADVKNLYGYINPEVEALLVEEDKILQAEREHEALLESLKQQWGGVADEADSFVESLKNIKGVNLGVNGDNFAKIVGADSPISKEGLLDYQQILSNATKEAIGAAVNSFGKADWKEFVSGLDLAFDVVSEDDGLNAKISEIKDLYALVSNYAIQNKLTQDETDKILGDILSIYEQILDRQEQITAEEKKQQTLQESLATMRGNIADYQKQYEQLGMSDREKMFDDLERAFKSIQTNYELTADEFAELTSVYNTQTDALERLLDAQEKLDRQNLYASNLGSLNSSTSDYQKQIAQFGMSDRARQFDDLERAFEELKATMKDLTDDEIEGLNEAYKLQMDALGELLDMQEEAERKNVFSAGLGTLNAGTADYQKQVAQFGMSDREKQFDDLERSFNALKATMSNLTEDELKDLNAAYELQKGALDELISKQEEEARRSKFETQLSSMQGTTAGYLKQIAQFDMSDNEKALNDLELAYKDQISNLSLTDEELAEINSEYQKQVDALTTLQKMQDDYNKSLEEENERKARQQELQKLYETASEAAANYQKQLEQYGMNDYQKTSADLQTNVSNSQSDQERDAWESAAASFRKLTFQGLLDSFSGLAYESEKAKIGMTEYEKSVYDLEQSYISARNSMDLTDDEQKLLYNNYMDQYNALAELNQLQEEYNAELEKQRQIEADQQAWQNLGSNALSSLGTVGGAVNTVMNGEGDIWTRLLTVVLDIAQQSEYWEDVVEILNEVLEPVLPLVGMIAHTLKNLKPVFDGIAFVLKVVASAIALIFAGINYVIDIIKWLGDWLAAAISNVAIKVYNLFHWKNKDEVTMPKLKNYLSETTEQTQKILEEIWHEEKKQNEQVDLSFLQELLRAGIIDEAGYNKRAGVKQAGLNWDTVSTSATTGYVDWSNKGANIVTNKVNITIEGNVTKENLEELEKVLGKYYGLQPTGMAY